jgi:hypothetical protein
MIDTEVEQVLREISERVRAVPAETYSPAPRAVESSSLPDENAVESQVAKEPLARFTANLSTIERAWSRLPPLQSYRQGWVARIELWIKGLIKRATHWYTWEQVNFNASVLATLRETLSAFSEYEKFLVNLRTELAKEVDEKQEQNRTELKTLSSELQAEALRVTGLESQISKLESRKASERADILNSVAASIDLLRHDIEEQRVSFKQLALEASENAALFDRARRHTEARLEELATRIDSTGKAAKSRS